MIRPTLNSADLAGLTAYTMKITHEETTSGVTVKMQVMLLYGPEVWIDVEPNTAIYVPKRP